MNLQDILNGLQTGIAEHSQNLNLPEGINASNITEIASSTVMSQLTSQAGSGNFSSILEMFSGSETTADSPVLQQLSPALVENLSQKLGIDGGTASGIAGQLLPKIMNLFNDKVNGGGFDLQSIIGQFQNGGIGDLIQNFISDQGSKTGGNAAGGFMDVIKGLFGK
jgi:uncharacterized protein YidB (DUF937 family)